MKTIPPTAEGDGSLILLVPDNMRQEVAASAAASGLPVDQELVRLARLGLRFQASPPREVKPGEIRLALKFCRAVGMFASAVRELRGAMHVLDAPAIRGEVDRLYPQVAALAFQLGSISSKKWISSHGYATLRRLRWSIGAVDRMAETQSLSSPAVNELRRVCALSLRQLEEIGIR